MNRKQVTGVLPLLNPGIGRLPGLQRQVPASRPPVFTPLNGAFFKLGGTTTLSNSDRTMTTTTDGGCAFTRGLSPDGRYVVSATIDSTPGSGNLYWYFDLADGYAGSPNTLLYVGSFAPILTGGALSIYSNTRNSGYQLLENNGTWANGDKFSVALDMLTGTFWIYKNGTVLAGDPTNGTGGYAFTYVRSRAKPSNPYYLQMYASVTTGSAVISVANSDPIRINADQYP